MKNNSMIPSRLNINFQSLFSMAEAYMPTSTTSSITSDNYFRMRYHWNINEKETNIIVSCIYRTPGSNMDSFINRVEENVTKTHHLYLRRLQHWSFEPKQSQKYRRIHLHLKFQSVVQIEGYSILTNVLDNNIISRLLINDITAIGPNQEVCIYVPACLSVRGWEGEGEDTLCEPERAS